MRVRLIALISLLLGIAVPAIAQQGAVEPPSDDGPGVPPAVRVVAGQDGIAIESGNGEYRLQFGLLMQGDGRFAVDDDADLVTDTFIMRRLRPYLRGRILRRFEFNFVPDFGNGTVLVQDAYLDTIFSQAFRIRAGKAKTPFGMERLQSGSNLLFMERAYPTSLAPNRDVSAAQPFTAGRRSC